MTAPDVGVLLAYGARVASCAMGLPHEPVVDNVVTASVQLRRIDLVTFHILLHFEHVGRFDPRWDRH